MVASIMHNDALRKKFHNNKPKKYFPSSYLVLPLLIVWADNFKKLPTH